jgi:hypothetical protein
LKIMEMNRLPIDKGFALLKSRKLSPSRGYFIEQFLLSISRSRQNIYGIAGFSGKANFPATAKILSIKILTSQNSRALHEMAYFDVKGLGENDKYKN